MAYVTARSDSGLIQPSDEHAVAATELSNSDGPST